MYVEIMENYEAQSTESSCTANITVLVYHTYITK